jgi:hypothetical protein
MLSIEKEEYDYYNRLLKKPKVLRNANKPKKALMISKQRHMRKASISLHVPLSNFRSMSLKEFREGESGGTLGYSPM